MLTEAERSASVPRTRRQARADVPYPFGTAAEMLAMAAPPACPSPQMKRANEAVTQMPRDELDARLDRIWEAMSDCIDRGLAQDGILPGGLKVQAPRRARSTHKLKAEQGNNAIQPHRVNDWLSVYAMAVNEENAAGGQVVTAPTNGAAGVMPAVIRYYLDHCLGRRRSTASATSC